MCAIRVVRLVFMSLVAALLALGCHAAEPQRTRATGNVTFYAAPNGIDCLSGEIPPIACTRRNDCLSGDNPCTPQGAHIVAKDDWDFAAARCTIKLAIGTYTKGVSIAGQYVGAHLCQVYGLVDRNGACIDREQVVFDVKNEIVFQVQDLMMTSIACLTVQGTGGSIGFAGRQYVVIDLAYIKCGAISQCIAVVDKASANVTGDIWIAGDSNCFACADKQSHLKFGGDTKIRATMPVSLRYFIMSFSQSTVEFIGRNEVINPEYIAGSSCWPYIMGIIVTSGMPLPCVVDPPPGPGNDGKVY